VVLGLLAGVSVGLACAGIAGARRTERAVPDYARAAHVPDAAVLANDPDYDEATQEAVARLPEVAADHPFLVAFALVVTEPAGLEGPLLPTTPSGMEQMIGVLQEGRLPDPGRADEIVVNEVIREEFGLSIGATMTVAQDPADAAGAPSEFVPKGSQPFEQQLRVVGISDSPDAEPNLTPSSGFYEKYRPDLIGPVNQFIDLKRGNADFVGFRAGVQDVVGHPVNVQNVRQLFGLEKLIDVSKVERNGLVLFAMAVTLGAGALVGQALVRAVTAGASDLATWRAIGADRRIVVPALVAPTLVTAAVGATTAIVVAIALSPRFPIAVSRHYDLGVGFHADWPVLVVGVAVLALTVLAAAWLTAEVRMRHRWSAEPRASTTVRLATAAGLSPPLLIGSRLAVEPGRGRRAVPVRSALVGATVGVLGVVACLTFRAGLSDAVADPARSGVVWDFVVAGEGTLPETERSLLVGDDAVSASLEALWERAVQINGKPTPTFGTKVLKGDMDLVVIAGRAPSGRDEIALAPATMRDLGVHIGDGVRVGDGPGRRMRVVGSALLPSSSHTDYDESAWMPLDTLQAAVASVGESGEDYLLLRFRPDADIVAAQKRIAAGAGSDRFVEPADLPTSVVSLGQLRSLPFVLAIFFALLAVATVAHALVTTVRRRRHDLAVLRSIGFTKRDTRLTIAWQATLTALVGLVLGVPLGIITGRLIWKQLAESFPVAYVPPLELFGLLLVVPAAIIVANLVAAGPAYAATRIRAGGVLRAE